MNERQDILKRAEAKPDWNQFCDPSVEARNAFIYRSIPTAT
ncbi:MAG: hypothetical protein P1V20_30370 [Verrucomicrobiales bacterium]|nr:hypothetical protein [Verrucomicrobiales bacterium]